MLHPRIVDIGVGLRQSRHRHRQAHATAEVTAIDKSPEGRWAIAKENAAKHAVAERIRFLLGDLFAPLDAEEQFHFIVSNPPYITDVEMPKLPVGVREFEPHLALQGGPDGFAVFDRLITEGANHAWWRGAI